MEGAKQEGPVHSLEGALGLGPREMISLAGAGGKTTMMFRLARELFLGGKKVVTTTTTKILEPSSGETEFLFLGPFEGRGNALVKRPLETYGHITLAQERLGSGKLKGIPPDLADGLWNAGGMDYMIVEADGAAGRPVKAPREKEPVFPGKTTLVVALLGLDGVGKDLNEKNVFQPDRVSHVTEIPVGGRMNERGMAILVIHPEGIFRGAPTASRVVVFLNKADVPGGVATGRKIAQEILRQSGRRIERVVLGQLLKETPVVEVLLP